MKKVLVFHPTIAPYRVDFFNALASVFETKVYIEYFNLKSQHFNNYQAILDRCQFKPELLKTFVEYSGRTIPRGIISHIKEYKPDIIIGGEFSFEVIVSILFRKITKQNYKILTLCDDNINMVSENNEISQTHKILRKIIVPRLDNIILPSPEVTNWYKRHFKIGCFFPIIRNEEIARKDYSEALPISNQLISKYKLVGKKVFLYVGRLALEKNVCTIIRAFSSMNSQDSTLVIIGSGPEENNLKKLSCKDKRIIFLGHLEGKELIAWYNIASTFILASALEPFGAVTNEALLGGCNVFISKNCGSSFLIKENQNGVLFNPYDISELAHLMQQENYYVDYLNSIRDNKMVFSFADLFSVFIQNINK